MLATDSDSALRRRRSYLSASDLPMAEVVAGICNMREDDDDKRMSSGGKKEAGPRAGANYKRGKIQNARSL